MSEERLSESVLERARTDARLRIIGEVARLYEEIALDTDLNQSRLAERLGVSRQAISKLLSGPGGSNLTVDKIGELLAGMGATIARLDMRRISELPASNEIHPWLDLGAEDTIGVEAPVIETRSTLPGGIELSLPMKPFDHETIRVEAASDSLPPIQGQSYA